MRFATPKRWTLVLAGLAVVFSVSARDARNITWDDLVPPKNFEDPFDALSIDQLNDFSMIEQARWFLEAEDTEVPEELIKEAEQINEKLVREGIDVEGLLASREEVIRQYRAMSFTVVVELNGQNVRMPGYVLPLEFDGDRVTEFFLVPYIGACIHAPTPPPNQMVHVSIEDGIESNGMYEPVWVSGIISTEGRASELSLVDGSLDVSAGYSMRGLEVEPYAEQ